MAHAHSDSKPSVTATNHHNTAIMPNGPNGKASAVAPKLSDDDHVELEDMLPTGPEVSPEEDIMQLARLGDVQGIEKLYDSGKYEPDYCDAEGITPLHVCNPSQCSLLQGADGSYSGQLSITSMRCANFS